MAPLHGSTGRPHGSPRLAAPRPAAASAACVPDFSSPSELHAPPRMPCQELPIEGPHRVRVVAQHAALGRDRGVRGATQAGHGAARCLVGGTPAGHTQDSCEGASGARLAAPAGRQTSLRKRHLRDGLVGCTACNEMAAGSPRPVNAVGIVGASLDTGFDGVGRAPSPDKGHRSDVGVVLQRGRQAWCW